MGQKGDASILKHPYFGSAKTSLEFPITSPNLITLIQELYLPFNNKISSPAVRPQARESSKENGITTLPHPARFLGPCEVLPGSTHSR